MAPSECSLGSAWISKRGPPEPHAMHVSTMLIPCPEFGCCNRTKGKSAVFYEKAESISGHALRGGRRGSEAGIIGDAPVPFAEELLQT